MPIIFNNTEIENVVFNGTELDKVVADGVTVFEKEKKPITITEKIYSSNRFVDNTSDASSKSIQYTFFTTYPIYNNKYTLVEKCFTASNIVQFATKTSHQVYSGDTVSSIDIPVPGQTTLFCTNAKRTYEKTVNSTSDIPKPYIVITYEYIPS